MYVLTQDASNPGNVTATLRNIMHSRMHPIPAFVSPACADVIRKALTRSAKRRITLDELADHAWIRSRAQEFQKTWASSGYTTVPVGIQQCQKEPVSATRRSCADVKEEQRGWSPRVRVQESDMHTEC